MPAVNVESLAIRPSVAFRRSAGVIGLGQARRNLPRAPRHVTDDVGPQAAVQACSRGALVGPEPAVPTLSVVMPCLNEARTVALCVSKAHAFFLRSGVFGEIIVADSGSTDGSPEARCCGRSLRCAYFGPRLGSY